MTQWYGCYADSWQGVITPESFAHPAKFARGLIRRIYEHMLESGYIERGDTIIDPFGGIAAGALDAIALGLHWMGCELEPHFVELGNANIAKNWHDLRMLTGRLGTARLLQGDSRRLSEIIGGGMAATISSPPYDKLSFDGRGIAQEFGFDATPRSGYGFTPGQLGAMRSGDYAAAVSSPPFSGDKNLMAVNGQGVRSDMVQRHGMVASITQQSPGNLAALRADNSGFSAAISSPPYVDAVNGTGEGPGARHDPVYHNGDNAYKSSSSNGYGDAPGNLGNESPETFWAAARVIIEQTYAVLRPGGYTAWVCKDFVRKGRRVPFSDQWEQLCMAVGFEPVERIQAMLVESHGTQLDIFGGETERRKERKSFFRRLAEKNGSPHIDHEDVIVLRKPQ